MEKLKMQTADMAERNVEMLGQMFPNCLTETINADGKLVRAIDFDKLRQELACEVVEGVEERYQFTWPDKRNAIRLANSPINKTLRPCREESVDFDNTENLYIEGDNLEVLKLLRENYLGKVKMIYIDPPYNTGNDFVYNDDFAQSKVQFEANSGLFDEDGNRLTDPMVQNTESNGRFHTDWLNMIYPRLKVAKDLLADDGVIFISIDHNEVLNLSKVGDEVFGAHNRIGLLSVVNNLKGRSDDRFFATCNEFVLVYTKNHASYIINGFELEDEELDSDYEKQDEISYYKLIGFRKTGNAWKREERPYMFYPVLFKDGLFSTVSEDEFSLIYTNNTFNDTFVDSLTSKYIQLGYNVVWPKTEDGVYGRWRWGKETFFQQKDINLEFNNAGTLCTKMRATFEDGSIRMKSAKTLWYKPEYDTGSSAKLLKSLFVNAGIFDNPKSLIYLKDIIKIATNNDSLILDFFSGSATTAHAVMQLNAEDGGSRKFIMVQLPEKTDEKSEAYKAGYENICEIGKERIRRAGKKIKEENTAKEGIERLDTGFRVLKLDESNMADVYYTPADTLIQQTLNFDALVDNIREGRTAEDLLFQVLPECNLPLSSKIEIREIHGKKVFVVEDGYLMACFDNDINDAVITAIAKEKPYYFVMCDRSIASDSVADNFDQIFNAYSKETVRRIL